MSNNKNKVLLQLTHKGYCNGFPMWVHQSEEYGVLVYPRILPTISYWYAKLWRLLFTKDVVVITHRMRDSLYLERDIEELEGVHDGLA